MFRSAFQFLTIASRRITVMAVPLSRVRLQHSVRTRFIVVHSKTFHSAPFNEQHHTVPEVHYDAVSRFVQDNKGVLLDVRTAEEVAMGCIPHAKHVPVDEIEEALKLDAAVFKERYGFSKPVLDDTIITYCRAGVRSMRAGIILSQHNYRNVSSYAGSWTEWSSRHPEHVKGS